MASLAASVFFPVKSSTGQTDSKIFWSIDLVHRLPKRSQFAFSKLNAGRVVSASV